MENSKSKILVIGLDGGTWKVLRPLIDEDIMPNLKKLVDTGVSGDLLSTLPAHSGPAWTSFMTGKNPGKHGIFGFTRLDLNEHPRLVVNSSRDIKSDTIFQILDKANKTAISINLPVTYPPFKVKGAIIGDCQLTPNNDCDFIYPADLFEKIGKDKKDYILYVKRLGDYNGGQELSFLEDINKSVERRTEFALRLMEKINWDLSIIVFTETDWLQHKMLQYIDPTHPLYNSNFKLVINKFFFKLDKIIFDLVEKAGKDTNVFIISDHGFGPSNGKLYINSLLESYGLLRIKENSISNLLGRLGLRKVKIKARKLKKFFIYSQNRLRYLLNQRSSLYRYIKKLIKGTQMLNKETRRNYDISKTKDVFSQIKFISSIDWSKTKAYHIGDTGLTIYLNLPKNKHNTDINKNDKEKIRNMITRILKEISGSETKIPFNLKMHKKEDIFWGPYLDLAPDFVLDPNLGYKFSLDTNNEELFIKTGQKWNYHYREGILLMQGNNLKENKTVNNASIMDIAPTMLYLLGLPIPEDMDGKVLKECIQEDFLNANPIIFQKSYEKGKKEASKEIYSKEDKAEIEKRLADLGYLD